EAAAGRRRRTVLPSARARIPRAAGGASPCARLSGGGGVRHLREGCVSGGGEGRHPPEGFVSGGDVCRGEWRAGNLQRAIPVAQRIFYEAGSSVGPI